MENFQGNGKIFCKLSELCLSMHCHPNAYCEELVETQVRFCSAKNFDLAIASFDLASFRKPFANVILDMMVMALIDVIVFANLVSNRMVIFFA